MQSQHAITRFSFPQLLKMFFYPTVVISLFGCGENQPQANIDTSAYVHTVASEPLQLQHSYRVMRKFSGRVTSKQSASLSFEVSGRIAAIFVDEGESVTKGQILARLDTELLTIEQQQLQAQVLQLKAEEELVDANLTRSDALIENGYASQQTVDELTAQKKVLRANQQQLQANLAAKKYQINHATIFAPFAGTINKRLINLGEVINPQIAAFELQQHSNFELKVGVPQHLIAKIKQQQAFNLEVNQQTITVTSLAVNSALNERSRTVQLRFPLPDGLKAYNNQLAFFSFEQRYQQGGFWIPLTALTDGIRGTWNVYTLAPESNDTYKLLSHSVEIIHSEQNRAFIRGDLAQDQLLLSAGMQRLVPGQLVKTNL
ncbi:efflux RND transporter periplasmic adaptor subunit [Thalassotalea sp. ND16A]|uniref:efflux RND transporter periplasmic adaptor subunit n=1 Tax=Thalassotalea sp. ND16A TaxID=1535422 RepID=UPI00051D2F51|nr:efflux RND transporter periplasmic adaptor subunit [Thalassotalea sp. ND16A]KGK01008.1 hypothetical protein ND16A_3210 [Thalassotalea sp. ND16A]